MVYLLGKYIGRRIRVYKIGNLLALLPLFEFFGWVAMLIISKLADNMAWVSNLCFVRLSDAVLTSFIILSLAGHHHATHFHCIQLKEGWRGLRPSSQDITVTFDSATK